MQYFLLLQDSKLKMLNYSIPYGKEKIDFNIPDEFKITVVTPKLRSPVNDIEAKTRNALQHPINSRTLLELAKGKNSACIVVTDITRDCPEKQILPTILETIEHEIDRKKITILVACGMHREMTYEEKVEKYGKHIVDSYRIIDHNGKDQKNLVSMGVTKNGTPIRLSKIACDSELLVSTGVVEPHQYGGYSGGYKTVAIGVASDKTISHTHSRKMLENPKIRPGTLEENPFREDIIEIGRKAGLDFIVNVVFGKEKEILEIKAGDPLETHNALIKEAKDCYEIIVEKSFDAAICGVGFPKDTNLYQTSRAASYLFYTPKPVIKNGGYIIIPAICQEGAGHGIGEQRFFSLLKDKTIEEILSTKKEFKAGEQRAFLMANVLKTCKIIIVGSDMPQVIKESKMIAARDMSEAFRIIKNDLGSNIDILLIPNALKTLPLRK